MAGFRCSKTEKFILQRKVAPKYCIYSVLLKESKEIKNENRGESVGNFDPMAYGLVGFMRSLQGIKKLGRTL